MLSAILQIVSTVQIATLITVPQWTNLRLVWTPGNSYDTILLWSVRYMGRIAIVAHQFHPAEVKLTGLQVSPCFQATVFHRKWKAQVIYRSIDWCNGSSSFARWVIATLNSVLFFQPYRSVHISFTKHCPWLDKLQWLYEDHFTDDLCWSAHVFDKCIPFKCTLQLWISLRY